MPGSRISTSKCDRGLKRSGCAFSILDARHLLAYIDDVTISSKARTDMLTYIMQGIYSQRCRRTRNCCKLGIALTELNILR